MKGVTYPPPSGPRDVVPQLGSLSAETLRTLQEKPWSCASKQHAATAWHTVSIIECGMWIVDPSLEPWDGLS